MALAFLHAVQELSFEYNKSCTRCGACERTFSSVYRQWGGGLDELLLNLDKLPSDKDAAIYLYCAGGPMGNSAARTLHDLGYVNLSNLEGGAHAWGKAGYAFE